MCLSSSQTGHITTASSIINIILVSHFSDTFFSIETQIDLILQNTENLVFWEPFPLASQSKKCQKEIKHLKKTFKYVRKYEI